MRFRRAPPACTTEGDLREVVVAPTLHLLGWRQAEPAAGAAHTGVILGMELSETYDFLL